MNSVRTLVALHVIGFCLSIPVFAAYVISQRSYESGLWTIGSAILVYIIVFITEMPKSAFDGAARRGVDKLSFKIVILSVVLLMASVFLLDAKVSLLPIIGMAGLALAGGLFSFTIYRIKNGR